MKEVELPFLSVFVCEICGHSSSSEKEIQKCESVSTTEHLDVSVWDDVFLYHRIPVNGRHVGMSDEPEIATITALFYASPYELGNFGGMSKPKRHQLCVRLKQRHVIGGERKAWRPDDENKLGIGSSTWKITYIDFLLWREGNRQKLEEVGLVEPVRARTVGSFFDRMRDILK